MKALLPAELAALTPSTVTAHADLFAELADTRVRGWACEREQNTIGLACFAVTIPGRDGYAISCSLPLARLGPGHQDEIVTALAEAAAELGQPGSLRRPEPPGRITSSACMLCLPSCQPGQRPFGLVWPGHTVLVLK